MKMVFAPDACPEWPLELIVRAASKPGYIGTFKRDCMDGYLSFDWDRILHIEFERPEVAAYSRTGQQESAIILKLSLT